MTVEQWRPIPSAPGYEASDLGRIRSLDRAVERGGHLLRCKGRVLVHKVHHGAHRVQVGSQTRLVHRLVLEAFVGPCPAGMVCCHYNDDSSDNRLVNLRWDTPSANARDQVRNGGNHLANRTHCPYGHLLLSPNLTKAMLPHRQCLACNRARACAARLRKSGQQPDFQSLADSYYTALGVAA